MALYRIGDRYPNYRDIYFDGDDLKGMQVYSAENKSVGDVRDLLINEEGYLKYLVVDLRGEKQVLLPIRSCARTSEPGSLYVRDLDGEDISRLSVYSDRILSADINSQAPVEASIPVEASVPVEATAPVIADARQSSSLQAQGNSAPDTAPISLYEERLNVRKKRIKTGEVKISKQVITETSEASVPIRKEKIVIEIESIYGGASNIQIEEAEVAADGSVQMDIYEERAEVCRQVVPYQNVSIKKEVIEDVVTTTETLRREEISINPEGQPYVEQIKSES